MSGPHTVVRGGVKRRGQAAPTEEAPTGMPSEDLIGSDLGAGLLVADTIGAGRDGHSTAVIAVRRRRRANYHATTDAFSAAVRAIREPVRD
jgi:hypothetical protein